ncbi:hypothetical protein COX67_04875 [Candidatus Falkowbacteria bacterium CG_4_10_14_0_2_um_filter_36_22]|uniref:GIY-YIG domain-containing protein n=1 Tax=Candidatus Falkowbacteria bacterium CG02_land_8_20_14_3_00_36_14 TaxID=1974560 RepID=A0A2M7DM77_9BACT|nr:MAG: hypothetical protein COS18_03835 [Candidatus Falkowbacteria bacterium CG02_land_8_20_14_3_00_36_14]PJA10308.1 MAG: hypothetical protein COX67_04875 [Candidatus Falkowbacteria bacterium CG_4_10_14_0_2_um_filter_36_22]
MFILCSDNNYYIGITINIHKRILEYNNSNSFSTKYRLPVKLKWIGLFLSKEKAVKFEKYLKTGSGNAFFRKRLV